MEEKKNCILLFIDEEGEKKDLFCDILKLTENGVEYPTSENWIFVPWARVLKIKTKKEDEE